MGWQVVSLAHQVIFILMGFSGFTGILSVTFACERKPKGMKHLVLVGTPASMELWNKGELTLVEALPAEIKNAIRDNEVNGTMDTPEYQNAVLAYMKMHTCRIDPWPQYVMESVQATGPASNVIAAM
jgi:hypothetical protein